MRQTLHDKTLSLVLAYRDGGGNLTELSQTLGLPYYMIIQWLTRTQRADANKSKPVRLNVDAVQSIYEHLTGKHLDY